MASTLDFSLSLVISVLHSCAPRPRGSASGSLPKFNSFSLVSSKTKVLDHSVIGFHLHVSGKLASDFAGSLLLLGYSFFFFIFLLFFLNTWVEICTSRSDFFFFFPTPFPPFKKATIFHRQNQRVNHFFLGTSDPQRQQGMRSSSSTFGSLQLHSDMESCAGRLQNQTCSRSKAARRGGRTVTTGIYRRTCPRV